MSRQFELVFIFNSHRKNKEIVADYFITTAVFFLFMFNVLNIDLPCLLGVLLHCTIEKNKKLLLSRNRISNQ